MIAAHAAPEDCGSLPPLAAFSASSSESVDGSRTTVMSAPIRVSQNGETDCFTDTADPFGLSVDDHVISLVGLARGARRAFEAGLMAIKVDASTLSWLQSSSRSLMSASSGLAAASVAGASSASSSSLAGGACACAGGIVTARPAASKSSPAKPDPVLEIITPPACQRLQNACTSVRNCGGEVQCPGNAPETAFSQPTPSSAGGSAVPAPAPPDRKYRSECGCLTACRP